jgi:hypothetical protein
MTCPSEESQPWPSANARPQFSPEKNGDGFSVVQRGMKKE